VVAVTPRSIDAGVGIGEIFVDKYRVERILGHGGMGVVAMCTHLALHEHVAIKMLRKDVLDDADAVERFMREAQAAVKLKSEYVARVIDVGRSSANVPYMVMEYLDGEDLGQLLEDRRTLGVPWAVEITMQCCEALAEAHSLGIVHRDVKPTNLFVTWRPDGSAIIKVLDFGISKALTGNSMALTQTQSLLGTPAYMSPEQMRSARNVDARTDIWSLGTVLYEMLEGRRPFEAESFSEMCVKVAVDPPGAMAHTPPALQQVVLRCLDKAPEQRYPSMADLARDLVPFAQDPHQAQVLVERMTRTLRRSQVQPVEWNPSSSGSSGPIRLPSGERVAETSPAPATTPPPLTATPAPATVPATAAGLAATAAPEPAASPASAVAPAHAGAPATGGAAARPAAETRRPTGSQPALSETLSVPRPRRRTALVIATAVIGAAALGVAISVVRTPAPAPSASPVSARGSASAAPPAGLPAPTMIPGAATPPTVPPMAAPTAVASDPTQSGLPNAPTDAAPVVSAGSDKAHPASGKSARDAPTRSPKSDPGNVPRSRVLRPGIDCRDTEHPEAYAHADPKLDPCPRQTPGN
jgi:eukaryotic-like serine/threonine-protein kinase